MAEDLEAKYEKSAKRIIKGMGEWWHYPDNIEAVVIGLLKRGFAPKEVKAMLEQIIGDIRREYGD